MKCSYVNFNIYIYLQIMYVFSRMFPCVIEIINHAFSQVNLLIFVRNIYTFWEKTFRFGTRFESNVQKKKTKTTRIMY